VTLWMVKPTESKEIFAVPVAKNGEGVRDIAKDSLLFDIEAQRNLGMLQIVVAAARKGSSARSCRAMTKIASNAAMERYRRPTATEDGARGVH